jgi:acetyltransferase
MDRFFSPKSVVLFGASKNSAKGGTHVMKNIQQYMAFNNHPDFYLVHPNEQSLGGIRCYAQLSEIPFFQQTEKRLDLAIIVVPVASVMPTIRECVKYNVRGILIESGNLSDDDEEVKKFTAEVKSLIQGKDIRITGPNSIGFNVPATKYCTPIKYFDRFLETWEHNASIIAQSGLFITGFVDCYHEGIAAGQPFGISHMAAIGNKLDVNECDILEYYLTEPKTHVIGMYLEDIREGDRFLQLLKRNLAEIHKPIVLLKSGRSEKGKKAISSHTGSLAGNYATIEAIAKQFGMMLVDSFEEFYDALTILCQYTCCKGDKIGVISISGAGCVLSSDFAERYGLELPELSEKTHANLQPLFPDWAPIHNPIDTWASIEKVGPKHSFSSILKVYLESKQYDAIIMMTISSKFASFDWNYFKEVKKQFPAVPLVLHFFGGETFQQETNLAYRNQIPVVGNLAHIFKVLKGLKVLSQKLF